MPDIRIAVPTGRSSLHARYLDDDQGAREARIRAPAIAVLAPPACACDCSLQAAPGAHGWLVALKAEFLAAHARSVLGEAPAAIGSRVVAWDPFLREAVTTLAMLPAHGASHAGCLRAYASTIALHLAVHYRQCRAAAVHGCGLSPARLALLEAFIREHLTDTILVNDMAALVHMSSFHFSRVFKDTVGHTPHTHVIMKRVEMARALLMEGELPLIEVASRTGFQTQQHFTEVFRRYTGATPRIFRLRAATSASPRQE